VCRDIEYDEWFEQPKEVCKTVTILKPKQTFEHKKKCLFHENENGKAPEPKHDHHEHHHGHHEHHGDHGNTHHGNHGTAHLGVSLRNRGQNSNLAASTKVHIGRRRSTSSDQATSSSNRLQLHPSLNGFELHKRRNGKSVASNVTVIKRVDNNQIAETPDKKSALLERNKGNPYKNENKESPVQTFHIGKKISSDDKLTVLLHIEILKTPPKENEKWLARKQYSKGVVQEINTDTAEEKTK
jgi:hypothetical protein